MQVAEKWYKYSFQPSRFSYVKLVDFGNNSAFCFESYPVGYFSYMVRPKLWVRGSHTHSLQLIQTLNLKFEDRKSSLTAYFTNI